MSSLTAAVTGIDRAPRVVGRALAPAPVQLVLGDPRHGVTRYAREIAEACGAVVVHDAARLDRRPAHLHATDRLLGASPEHAAGAFEALTRRTPLSVTLHDVPQPTDGPGFRDRVAAYARIVRAARGWVVSSEHERSLVHQWVRPDVDGAVVPLPVPVPVAAAAHHDPAPVVGLFGYVYPGKGHRHVVRALAGLVRAATPVTVRLIGGPAPGHDDEVDDLRLLAEARGVPLEVTGHVAEADVVAQLQRVAVPVVAHRNVSASGSLNSWLAAGRRPLVRDGVYAREMARRREGTVTLFRDDTLADRVDAALRRPASTWLEAGTDLRPLLPDAAAAYLAWWRTLA
ncbi:hypothetical protein ABFT23_01445 [Nocardioides sp. C4-1]|uniref:hypothetical protein n=1 Tax=Nocardioides sp. C4-1 TaxID=3151851 RepID=UPI0032644AB0